MGSARAAASAGQRQIPDAAPDGIRTTHRGRRSQPEMGNLRGRAAAGTGLERRQPSNPLPQIHTMKISSKALWLALHRVLTSEGVNTGDSISLKTLMQAWNETGLRQSDLAAALESLVLDGFIRLSGTEHGPSVQLLDEQFGELRPNSHDRELVDRLDILRRQRRPHASHLAPLMERIIDGRRAEDRPTPSLPRAA